MAEARETRSRSSSPTSIRTHNPDVDLLSTRQQAILELPGHEITDSASKRVENAKLASRVGPLEEIDRSRVAREEGLEEVIDKFRKWRPSRKGESFQSTTESEEEDRTTYMNTYRYPRYEYNPSLSRRDIQNNSTEYEYVKGTPSGEVLLRMPTKYRDEPIERTERNNDAYYEELGAKPKTKQFAYVDERSTRMNQNFDRSLIRDGEFRQKYGQPDMTRSRLTDARGSSAPRDPELVSRTGWRSRPRLHDFKEELIDREYSPGTFRPRKGGSARK